MFKTEEALAIIGGHVDEELLLRNEYLAIENEILRKKISGRVKLSQRERMRLAAIGKKIGIKALREVAMIVKPETIITWYRKLIAAKFDSSKRRKKKVGRPLTDCELETLILQISKRNPRWGYDRIAGALANLGYHISDQTVGNILKRNGIMPAPGRCLHQVENQSSPGVTSLLCIKMWLLPVISLRLKCLQLPDSSRFMYYSSFR